MEIRPVDLPAFRFEMAHLGDLPEAQARQEAVVKAMLGATTEARNAMFYWHGLMRSLREADLYFVAADMASLAEAAASGLPHFDLAREDIPTPRGLLVFERDMPTPSGTGLAVRGVVWGEESPGLLTVHLLSDSALYADVVGKDRGSILTRLSVFHTVTVPLDRDRVDSGISVLGEGAYLGDEELHYLRVLKTTWLLMGQTLCGVANARYDRASVRRLARQGVEPRQVRVITLRRPPGSAGDSESTRDYHHQWIVRGHWRQQWYATRQVHRPVWIAPHIKGPEGAPLLGGEKVYALRR
jgi:hypothetical protein